MNTSRLYRIRQEFNQDRINDIQPAVLKELNRINVSALVKPGMKIGITVGSRGIHNLTKIIKGIIDALKDLGCHPFLIPSMGSHGGANAEGQLQILAKYGFTEAAMGVPIRSGMEVVKLGELENGVPVYFDKIAYEADGVVVVNRVKVHTAFKSDIESGLHKMVSVGLGNHESAKLIHSLGGSGLMKQMVESAKLLLAEAPIMFGVGILENAYDETVEIKAGLPDEFYEIDAGLLKKCKELLPSLPTSRIDILVVQEFGKNISGTGLDTNIVGQVKTYKKGQYHPPEITRIMLCDLSDETQGNAFGMGIGDIITRKAFEKIDYDSTYKNAITATFLDRVRIPIVVDSEEEAFQIAQKTCWVPSGKTPRVVIIKNTLRLDEIIVSENVWREIKNNTAISLEEEIGEISFDNSGHMMNRIK